MSDETTTELIRNLPGILTALGVILAGYWAYQSKKQSQTNATTLAAVDKKVDGMSTDLVAATAGKNFAEGQLNERDAERVHLEGSEPTLGGDSPVKVKVVKPDIEA